jgi:enediyne polyketide synthase
MSRIAIVGMGCRYPDADSPERLWENVLAGRRAFRQLPEERMRLDDYYSPDPAAPDRFYARMAAVLTGWEFDRVAFKVAGSTYRSTDLTHWLALDVAARALADAGFPGGDGLPRDRTGVVIGNTLTGEFTRANVLRLRWPYVRRVMAAALRDEGWDDERLGRFLAETERTYKAPFPAVDEDTLAGGLSNTIAGRICNHFDLHGGGYTVDGACSSSLLSVITACRSLAEGDVSVALAGGVDLSIDPFEMVGFAKTGALARREMLVYDRNSNGFWPGEGCGLVVLMREEDALAAGHRVYTTIAGWGISSDGRGGITRPEADGHRLALSRAYRRAGFGIGTVPLFEGHGTGTEVGDTTELRALSEARRADRPRGAPAAISSIKAMIGHTKAAAGIAGLIKATLAVYHGVITPMVGCRDPHPELTGDGAALRVVPQAEPWPVGAPRRAGVTALGFGGINTHIVLDEAPGTARPDTTRAKPGLARSAQDAELLLVDADSPGDLRDRLAELAPAVARMSYAELGDLAHFLQAELADRPFRAAVAASTPSGAERAFTELAVALADGRTTVIDPVTGAFAGHVTRPVRIGFLFPGQGSGHGVTGGALRRRFSAADALYHAVRLPEGADPIATEVVQPRIVTGSMAALRVLRGLGVEATVALGHSLGELTALHWAGGISDSGLFELATARGAIMAQSPPGAMLGIAAGPAGTGPLIAGEPVVVAGYNGAGQTVVAGPPDAVDRVAAAAANAGLVTRRLAVSHAFHSPLMADAGDRFRAWLSGRDAGSGTPRPFDDRLGPLSRRVVSTVTGAALTPGADLRDLLHVQFTAPVRFDTAVLAAASEVDLFLEVGPGRVLTRMVRDLTPVPVLPVDSEDPSIAGLLAALGAAWTAGAPLAHESLYASRPNRPVDLSAPPRVLAGPCESAPAIDLGAVAEMTETDVETPAGNGGATADETLAVLLRLAAERAELPAEVVNPDAGLLDHLHLSSITVGQLVNQAVRELGLPAVQTPINFATASARELAEALHELSGGGTAAKVAPVAGAGPWIRAFGTDWTPTPVPAPVGRDAGGPWQVFGPGEEHAAVLRAAGLGPGVLLVRPRDPGPDDLAEALAAMQAAVAQPAGHRLVVVQHSRGVTALAKTARLEGDGLITTVVIGPVPDLAAEVAATMDFTEVAYHADGLRRIPELVAVPLPHGHDDGEVPLGSDDVLLVTGGGKGITAECALSLAAGTGARLALLGRSDPQDDPELARNLERMAAQGVTAHYLRADVTVPAEVRTAVAEVRREWGPITAVLHGAGRNQPTPLTALTPRELHDTLAPKVGGLTTVLDAVEPTRLRLLITFGSIIGRTGLHGEAHYALANDHLAELTEQWARRLPDCRTVCLEWSVWSGAGMGERLSVVEALERAGITPITPDLGVRALRRALAGPGTPPTAVVCGRTSGLETLRFRGAELPLLRFVAQPLVHYPDVELVTEVTLAERDDPYLADHTLHGDQLMPAVLGMEAMAQVAAALTGRDGVPAFEAVSFLRPIVVPHGGATTVRVAALVTGPETADLAIRSDETAFAADHFRATLRWGPREADTGPAPRRLRPAGLPPVDIEPGEELYGGILFQGKSFQRLLRYHRITARAAEYDVATRDTQWFSPFLPGHLMLGDPGARDAVLHGIQVCVPDAVLLPAGVDRIEPAGPRFGELGEVCCVATERHHDGDTYVYDVTVHDSAGTLIERWTGLRLRAVGRRGTGPWPAALTGSLLHRPLAGRLGRDVAIGVEPHGDRGTARPSVTATALSRLLGRPVEPRHRPDGRPETDYGACVSVAHGDRLTLVVAGDGTIGCDVEEVVTRTAQDWADLLGPHAASAKLVAEELGEPYDVAATRLWCAIECRQKAGRLTGPTLSVDPGEPGPWQVLTDGGSRIATVAVPLRDRTAPAVIAVLAGDERS